MKRLGALFFFVMTLLPLLVVSCLGGGQLVGGWAGVAAHDGVIYLGTRDGRVVAVNASAIAENASAQALLWEWPEGSGTRSLLYATPVVSGELVYVGTYDGRLYALTGARGVERWVYPRSGSIGSIVAKPVVADDSIYVTSSDGRVYALDITYGDLKWRSEPLGGKLWTSPAVTDDAVLVSTFDGLIYALSKDTGQLLDWYYKSQAGFASSPVVHEGIIYVGSFDNSLYGIRIGHNESAWRFSGARWFWAAPLVHNATVYAGCLDGKVYAVESNTGRKLWEFDTGKPVVCSPVVVDDVLIVVNEAGNVYVIDPETGIGERIGNASNGGESSINARVRAACCAADGLVYVRAEDNKLYVINVAERRVSEPIPLTK